MPAKGSDNREEVTVGLTDELMSAVVGWRDANDLLTNADAVNELVRLGLLSEISKVHGLVVAIRDATH